MCPCRTFCYSSRWLPSKNEIKMKKTKSNKPFKHSFRLSFDEQKLFLENLQKTSLSKSEFLRSCLANAKVKAKFSTEEKGYYRNMIGIGTNLNQLAKRANESKEFIYVASELRNTFANLNLLIEKFNKL